jgi:hypothetical protein
MIEKQANAAYQGPHRTTAQRERMDMPAPRPMTIANWENRHA